MLVRWAIAEPTVCILDVLVVLASRKRTLLSLDQSGRSPSLREGRHLRGGASPRRALHWAGGEDGAGGRTARAATASQSGSASPIMSLDLVSIRRRSEFTIRAMCWRAGVSALRGRSLARCSCRIFSVPEGSSSRVTSPRYGGIADHPRTCFWFNPVVKRNQKVGSSLAARSGRCRPRPTRQL